MEQIEPKIECEPLVPQIKNEIVEDEPIMPNITENGPEIYIKLERDCDEYENSPRYVNVNSPELVVLCNVCVLKIESLH